MLEVLKKIKKNSDKRNIDELKLEKAFQLAEELYCSAGLSMDFVLKVIDKLMPFKPDENTIIAIILYDLFVLEEISEETILKEFDEDALFILNNLKKLSSLHYVEYSKDSQAEVLRKMFITLAKDIRVVVIWLSARICQLIDLDKEDEFNNKKIARETMHIYVPIASRLGIYRIKTELEDLSFKYLDSESYSKIKNQIDVYAKERKEAVAQMVKEVDDYLKARGLQVKVVGRTKSIYSTYRKMKRKNIDHINQLYDFFAIRVILEKSEDPDFLYAVLGLIHSNWRPISKRFKDYVAVPKPNGYRSLHTVVLGLSPKDSDQPIEIQIRNMEMHREAEFGIASHWLYKDTNGKLMNLNSQIDWLKGFEQLDEVIPSNDFLTGVDIDMFKDRIFVLTPRGDVKDLPAGSVPVDFAYAVHSEVGNQCVMAKVNGSVVSLDYELHNGDVVEIITKKDSSPKLEWLSKVKSSFARNRIKSWFSNLNRENNVKEGRRLINKQLIRLGKPLLDHNYSLLREFEGHRLTVAQRENLLEEIGKGVKIASNVIKKIFPYEKSFIVEEKMADMKHEALTGKDVIVAGQEGMPVKFAACCNPSFGESIVAYVTSEKRISIHKSNCRLLDSLDVQRIHIANWKNQNIINYQFSVEIDIQAVSRIGLLQEISTVFATYRVRIADIKFENRGADMCDYFFLIQFNNPDLFDLIVDKLEDIDGILRVSIVSEKESSKS